MYTDVARIQYVAAFPYNVGRLPDWITFAEGATLGVGSVASAAALFESLAIPWPSPKPYKIDRSTNAPWILVWGGSCVTGMMTIQLAKLSGFQVLAVGGLHNISYLQGLGADKVLDRHQPEEAIMEAREFNIKLAVDCVGSQTAAYAARALQSEGRLVYLVKGPDQALMKSLKIEVRDIAIKRFHEDPAYGQFMVDFISQCVMQKTISPMRVKIFDGGFDAIQGGLEHLKQGEVSGRKLVVIP